MFDKEKFPYIFVIAAMFLYTLIRITAFVCATIIALDGNLWVGGLLFGASLFMRFQFSPPSDKKP